MNMKMHYNSPQVTVVEFKVEEGFTTSFTSKTSSYSDLDLLQRNESVGSGGIYGSSITGTETTHGSWF